VSTPCAVSCRGEILWVRPAQRAARALPVLPRTLPCRQRRALLLPHALPRRVLCPAAARFSLPRALPCHALALPRALPRRALRCREAARTRELAGWALLRLLGVLAGRGPLPTTEAAFLSLGRTAGPDCLALQQRRALVPLWASTDWAN
jgi:hypothetical protein